MTTAWITLVIAGLLEVGWAIGIKYTDGFNFRTRPLASVLTLSAMIVSMYLLAQAIRTIPVGTGYAIWTGIGALGAATLGIILFQEPATVARILCLLMLVAGIIGLKLTTPMASGKESVPTSDLFIGGYGEGVFVSSFDSRAGTLTSPRSVAKITSASFIAHHPTLPVVYAISEVGSGEVVALRKSADGAYAEIARSGTGGNGPCHLSVLPDGKAAFIAHYGDGRVSMIKLNDDGTFHGEPFVDQHVGTGPNAKRQDRAYAHSIYPHPDGTHVLSADLGCDAIFVYRIDLNRGELTDKRSFPLPPGSGPRHLAISKDGRFIYCVNELANTVDVLRWNAADASLTNVQTISTLPADFKDNSSCAEIRLHPSGRFLYASNRGHNSIATYAVDPDSGQLKLIDIVTCGGVWPRGFEVDPSGAFLIVANQRSDSLAILRIDRTTGVPGEVVSHVPVAKPACVRFGNSPP